MNIFRKLLSGAAIIPACLCAQQSADSIADAWEQQLSLHEVVIVAKRPVVKQQDGKLVYLVKNDPYAKGLDGVEVLDRIPRVAVSNGTVSVAGKGNVRYIIDGILMELDASAMAMRLQNLRAEDIEKVELLTTPPSRYAIEPNAAYIAITTRNETLGTRGSIYGSLNQGDKLREYFSGSVSHTTRKVEMALDASVSNYYTTNDNDMEYHFADGSPSRLSSTSTKSHLFDAGVNALLRYKFTPKMSIGVIANYNYQTATSNGANVTDYDIYTSSSLTATKSRPNNALTVTGFYDWTFGKNGEMVQLTYNYFNRHSPTQSDVATTFSDSPAESGIRERGAADYRFHSGKADFKLPFSWAQMETGVAYTDILNSSDNMMQRFAMIGSAASTESNIFDYSERIAAAYVNASRSFGNGLWGKVGLRYEHTWTKGSQMSVPQTDRDSYGRLFPTANLSWNKERVGTFNVSYSMGMGRPNLWELNPFRYYTTTDEYAAGNPGLKPTVYHNAEVNYYGLGGLYAVLYTSFASDAIGYMRRFDGSGLLSTVPYNCLSTNKTGLYANYKRNFFDRWELKAGGEVFRTYSRSDMADVGFRTMEEWSGKLEASTNVMLNRQKTLIFGAQFTHFFPWQQNLINYESFQIFNLSLRYSMLGNRLNLQLKANDIFGWNKTKSREHYANYTIRQTFNSHSAYVLVGISYRFGRDKVNGVYHASKEEQSSRTK
ncbi:MAG: outer membrane beta-barrel family protein [Candidatus Amulumruptor caecigallinarius]|nr:outer membrane beta-barrel family protein [Candidatus Amulumruptor caecigallinarius]MCM1397075.1 outer membrane beta-barrel family protein [Candidatus Amulumruptor caecigallinarius]MCM1454061.1 outer membrane beta-barrel family protein [bacterium]